MKNKLIYSILLILIFICLCACSDEVGVSSLSANNSDFSENDDLEKIPEFTTIEELDYKKIAIIKGASFDKLLRSDERLTHCEILYYNSHSDIIQSLIGGKSDCVVTDKPAAECIMRTNDRLMMLDEEFCSDDYAFGFRKGDPLQYEFNEELNKMCEDGTIKELEDIWFGTDESLKILPEQDWPGTNGTIEVWTLNDILPMEYLGDNGKLMGYEIHLMLLCAKNLDYHINFTYTDPDGRLAGLVSGKADIAVGSFSITEERKETIDFSVPTYHGAVVGIVRNTAFSEDEGFLESVKASFIRTFITDSRYKLILDGVYVTVIISVLSIIFGTFVGLLFYFQTCKNKGIISKILNKIINLLRLFMSYTPMMVILMIMFYLIFGKINISGIIVSVITFGLSFAISVMNILKMGFDALPGGQKEAGLSLGFSENATFFRILLPQAVYIVMPSYKSEIVNLIRATAIVGYIAVQDLTKASDIIRGQTFEAFFPLIATAIIYFIIIYILIQIVDTATKYTNPRNRSVQRLKMRYTK